MRLQPGPPHRGRIRLQLIGRIYKLVASNRETLKGALAIIPARGDAMAPVADWKAIATSRAMP